MDALISKITELVWHIDVIRGVFGNAVFYLLLSAGGALVALWLRWRFGRRSGPVYVEEKWPEIAKAINLHFDTKVTLVKILRSEPILEIVGDLEVDNEVRSLSKKIASAREQNSKNAVLAEKGDLDIQPPKWRVRITPHSTILALRQKDRLPPVLSGNTLLCCSSRREVYLHYRSEKVDTKKGVLHIFGGSYEHSQFKNDEASLRRTAEREVREESGVSVVIPADCIRIVATEDDTGFVQLNFCGVDVPAGSVDVADSTNSKSFRAEGSVLACPFHKVGETLVESLWAESGKAVVLAWLALGAPTTRKPGFSSRLAKKMYREAMERLSIKASVVQ
jgi:hypothetical protein